jgi:hypothetical protein
MNNVIRRLKAGIVESEHVTIIRQPRGKHVSVATNKHATTGELLEAVFSMRSVSRNSNVRAIGQGEAIHRKYKRLKLGGGQAYHRSSD